MTSDEQRSFLQTVADVLLRCFIFSFSVMMFWFVMVMIMGDLAYRIHSALFDIARHDFDMMNYYGMAILKMLSFTLFLFPYIAIKLALRKK